MAFFRNFPLINYKFGDETSTALFQNITAYVDLIDQVSDDASFYQKYTIKDGDRPDSLSYKLYNTVDYYWTFFLLNEHLRTQGWPLTVQELYEKSREYYPNQTIVTEDEFATTFKRGDTVIQGNVTNPSGKGVILERNLDLGQIVVQPIVEVRQINITEGGTGYLSIPTITITGGNGGSGATATATVVNGTVTAVTVITGGRDYTTTPTVTISAPEVVDYTAVSNKITEIVNGTLVSGPYYDFLTANVSGYARADVDNDLSVTSIDASLVSSYGLNPQSVTADVNNKITTILRPAILANAASLPLFVPGGYPGVTATAEAVLSNNTFVKNKNLQTVTGVPNNLDWNVADIDTVYVKSSVGQYDSIHHYEDTDGDWADIDPHNQISAAELIPVTHYERLQAANDSLKEIKVLKPAVASQVYREFQKLLTRK